MSDYEILQEMESAHDKEMMTRGWSRWSITSGADRVLIPAIGIALRKHFHRTSTDEPAWVTWLINAGEVPGAVPEVASSTYEAEVNEHIKNVSSSICELANLWKQSPDVVNGLRLNDCNPIQSLGHAMVWFGKAGTYGCGPDVWPYPYVNDDTDADYKQWKKDIVRYGTALTSLNEPKKVLNALVWLSKYYPDLCD